MHVCGLERGLFQTRVIITLKIVMNFIVEREKDGDIRAKWWQRERQGV